MPDFIIVDTTDGDWFYNDYDVIDETDFYEDILELLS